jgi:hypothetical protein
VALAALGLDCAWAHRAAKHNWGVRSLATAVCVRVTGGRQDLQCTHRSWHPSRRTCCCCVGVFCFVCSSSVRMTIFWCTFFEVSVQRVLYLLCLVSDSATPVTCSALTGTVHAHCQNSTAHSRVALQCTFTHMRAEQLWFAEYTSCPHEHENHALQSARNVRSCVSAMSMGE